MTVITHCNIQDFRNLTSLSCDFSAGVNLIIGVNGSGKTSMLEAIYILANGKSFRSSIKSHIIQHNKDQFTVFAELIVADKRHRCGLEKSLNGNARLQINGEKCRSLAKSSELLPIILIDPHSYDLIEEGPSFRRHYMDWLLFHVKHEFSKTAQEYTKCLKQRNSALKQQLSKDVCQTWDPQLIELSKTITEYRLALLENLKPLYQSMVEKLGFSVDVRLVYSKGWPEECDFAQALCDSFRKDQALGYTTVGPQRADIKLTVENIPASDVLSRGQSKLAIAALLLAQGQYYCSIKNNSPIYLVDDLASELDLENRAMLFSVLKEVDGQMFITATNEAVFPSENEFDGKVFHVKHGVFKDRASCV